MKNNNNIIPKTDFSFHSEHSEIVGVITRENDNINYVDIRNMYDMEREHYLKKHNHNIWQAKDGKWKTYVDDENSPRGYKLKVKKTQKEIEDLVIQFYKLQESDPYIDKVFDEWNNQRLSYGEITTQTYNRYANDFKRFFPKSCPLRKIKFKQITEDDLETFIKTTIHEMKLTYKMYSGLRTIIRGIFKYGKNKHYTNISITTFLGDLDLSRRIFVKTRIDKESEVFSETEISLIKPYLKKQDKLRDLGILLAFETGLRVGELSALKKDDINKSKKYIHVQRTEVTFKDPVTNARVCEVRDFPKTEAGDRHLIIPASALQIIDRILELNKHDEYLFSENNKRIRSNAFNRRLARVCDDLHIKHRSMHKIRKTYGTTLLNANVDESTVAEQMGHTDISTTKRFYYRSNRSDNTKYEQINKALCVNN